MRNLIHILLIVAVLLPFSASAANTLEVFEPKTWTLIRSIAIGADVAIEDVYCEAYWCWTIDSTVAKVEKLDLFFVDWTSGTAALIDGFSGTVGAGNWGITSCGGDTLYVGDTYTEGAPVSAMSNIRVLDRNGTTIKNVARGMLNTTLGNSPQDLECDGRYLKIFYNAASGEELMVTYDPFLDVRVKDSNDIGRTLLASAFNGKEFYTAIQIGANFFGMTMGKDGLINTGVTAITNSPQGFFFDGRYIISARR